MIECTSNLHYGGFFTRLSGDIKFINRLRQGFMLSEKNRRVYRVGHPIRVLIVEDSEDDADLMIRHLRKGGFKPRFERVESAHGLTSALQQHGWDIILCDHNMPGFDSVAALKIVNKTHSDIPFILISDAIPSDIADKLTKEGARATLSKQKMDLLVPSVVKELQTAMAKKQDQRNSTDNKNSSASEIAGNNSDGSTISLFEAQNHPDENPKNTESLSQLKNGSGNDSSNGSSKPIKNILIVEDEMIQSILLEKLIKSLGYKVVGKVTTGADAINMALELQPDVITMDISLQDDIDGIMATKSIQEKSMIPVIYISGNSDQYNYQRAEKTNFIDFIPKPVNKESLAKSFSKAEEIRIENSSSSSS